MIKENGEICVEKKEREIMREQLEVLAEASKRNIDLVPSCSAEMVKIYRELKRPAFVMEVGIVILLFAGIVLLAL